MAQLSTAASSKSLWFRLTPDVGTTVFNILGSDVFDGGFRVLSIVLDIVTTGGAGSSIAISSGGVSLFTGVADFPTNTAGTFPLGRINTSTTGSIGPSESLSITTKGGGSTSRILLNVSNLDPRVVING